MGFVVFPNLTTSMPGCRIEYKSPSNQVDLQQFDSNRVLDLTSSSIDDNKMKCGEQHYPGLIGVIPNVDAGQVLYIKPRTTRNEHRGGKYDLDLESRRFEIK